MKRFGVFSLLAALLLSVSALAAGSAVSCPSALLMEKQTGTVLFAQDEHTPREPASVTKIMTLLLTMEAIDSGALSYDDIVTGSAHAAGMGGSQIWLKENERMTVRDLLKAVCIVSGNDAAVALAEHLAGSEDAFVERMNLRAQELGMNDTHFVNCTGLPAAGHLTSAYDIALMSRELILRHPDIQQFTTVWMDSLRDGASMLVNTNKLVRFYDGTTGLKTGSTDSAGYCLSATAERNGMELIAVVLKGKTSDERFSDAKSLLNYGFSTWALVTVTPDEVLPPVPVTLGVQPAVQPVLTRENALLVEKGLANDLTKEVVLAEGVAAPVYEGDVLGQLTVRDAAGNTVAVLPLLAGETVGHVTYAQMLRRYLALGFCFAARG
ncbi:D-alanyl-D-alanine carboxypeptidase [Oscillibacter valericigenes]|nr:D-alanyl-D-alanine carboxypeptidase [Oscillibacter valericigenes]